MENMKNTSIFIFHFVQIISFSSNCRHKIMANLEAFPTGSFRKPSTYHF